MHSQFLRVLLAEDGVTETGITLRSLCAEQGRGLELIFVSNRDSLSHTLLHFQPHVSFLALSMLQPDPYCAVSLLHYSAPRVPLILFALPADKDCAAKCLEAGAQDYMLEGYMDEVTLDRVLRSAIQGKPSLSLPAIPNLLCDALTGLPNRSGLLHSVQHSLQNSPLSNSRLIFFVQINSRKKLQFVNGGSAAMQRLPQVAQLLQRCVRRSDLIGHVSKDLFVIVVTDAAESCVSGIQRRLESHLLHLFQRNPQWQLQFSIQNHSWRSASPFSISEFLSAQLACHKMSPLSMPTPAGKPLDLPSETSGL